MGGEAFWLETADKITLRAALWRADGLPRGTILLCNGRSEFIEKYYPIIAHFRDFGFDLITFDWRGQGLSDRLIEDRLPGYVDDFASYQRDLDTVLAEVDRRGLGTRIILVGHSMGGCALVRRLADPDRQFHGAILTAPMLGMMMPTLAKPALRAVSWSLSHWEVGKRRISPREVTTVADWTFEDNVLTHNRSEFERYAALVRDHPDLALGGVTWAWMDAAIRETRELSTLPEQAITEPMLIFSAENEAVVSNDAINDLVARNDMVTLVHLQDSQHEPFIEEPPVQAILWREIGDFLDRIAPIPHI